MGRYVATEAKRKVNSNPTTRGEANSDPPFDLSSFLWGIVAGGIITIVVEGVAIYFTWPYVLSFLKGAALIK